MQSNPRETQGLGVHPVQTRRVPKAVNRQQIRQAVHSTQTPRVTPNRSLKHPQPAKQVKSTGRNWKRTDWLLEEWEGKSSRLPGDWEVKERETWEESARGGPQEAKRFNSWNSQKVNLFRRVNHTHNNS